MFVAESEWTPADEADYRQGVRSLFAAASGGAAGGITAATDADAVALLDETAERQPEHSVFARSTAIASAPTESTDSTAESAGTVTNARLGEEAGDSGIHL